MAACSYCNSTILFGGKRVGPYRFCNDNCVAGGQLLVASEQVPSDVVLPLVQTLHMGPCPKCNGPGPVDVFTAYTVWSALVVTSWKSEVAICCESCGRKSQWRAALIGLVVGWWGFPWGFVVTPIQVGRNIFALMQSRDLLRPSPELERAARLQIAGQALASPAAGRLVG